MTAFSRSKKACAIANLLNMGGSALADVVDTANDWAERQSRKSLYNIMETIDKKYSAYDADVRPGTMYLSFHYSLYPILYRALSKRSPQNTVYSLIGHQADGHRTALASIANNLGFCVEFVQSGPSMVKTLRRAHAEGHSSVMLLDIPWSKYKAITDIRYPVPGGCFLGISSIDRLTKLIDENVETALICRRGDDFDTIMLGHCTLSDAFCHFGRILRADPADYERLDEFHKFFEFDAPRDFAITFQVQGDRYILASRSMKAWRIADSALLDALSLSHEPITNDNNIIERLSETLQGPIDAVISI